MKTLTLFIPFLGKLSLQTRTKNQNLFKRTLRCCKTHIDFKNKIKFSSVFGFKERLPYNLMSCVVYKFSCRRFNGSYYSETDKQLKVKRTHC